MCQTDPVGELQALQRDVLEAVASGQSLDHVAQLLCEHVERIAPEVVCSLLSVDEGGRLRPLAAPSLPAAFSLAIDGAMIGPNIGSCGTAAYHGHSIEVHDIDTDPRWTLFKAMPLAAGLRACWSSPIKNRDGRVVGTFAFYYGVCRAPRAFERQIVEVCVHLCSLAIGHDDVWRRLTATNQRFEAALHNMSQGLCFFDNARNLVIANRRYSEIYGLLPGSMVPGTSLLEIVDLRVAAGTGPAMPPGEYWLWRNDIQTSAAPTDTIVELVDGRVIAIHHQPLPDGGWVATHEDITEHRRAQADAVYMARHDALTKLPNRILFNERIEQALAGLGRGQTCAMLCLDLDRFKIINDTFGHAGGDLLLQGVAGRLQACVREVDTVTRLGGDEFAILLVGLDHPESAAELAQRVVRTLCEPFEINGYSMEVSTSIGIAVAPDDGTSPARLLKSADTALYRAKQDERGSYRFFESEMDARLQARILLERDFRGAINNGEFLLMYQPLLNLADNEICSFEALLRWPHPVRGLVSPAEFIPFAEETGLIVPLGAWVLQQACLEAAKWPSRIKVAVNLSAIQFKKGDLVATVRQALAKAGLPGNRLELEITESILLNDSNATLAVLHALRDLGASISMDDFGTGYSSLSYLRSFPFDKIKIDQSFIQDISVKPDALAIIRAVVGLGRSLSMVTTAEGVETSNQLAQLRREGCNEIQGYLFSHPVSAEHARLMVGIDETAKAGWSAMIAAAPH